MKEANVQLCSKTIRLWVTTIIDYSIHIEQRLPNMELVAQDGTALKFVHNMQAGQHRSEKVWHSWKKLLSPFQPPVYDQKHDHHHGVGNCHWLCRLWVKTCQKPCTHWWTFPKNEMKRLCLVRVFLCPIYPSTMGARVCVCARDIRQGPNPLYAQTHDNPPMVAAQSNQQSLLIIPAHTCWLLLLLSLAGLCCCCCWYTLASISSYGHYCYIHPGYCCCLFLRPLLLLPLIYPSS